MEDSALIVQVIPTYTDSRVQRLVEGEQQALTCALLAAFAEVFLRSEWSDLSGEIVRAPDADATTNRLLSLLSLHHLLEGLTNSASGQKCDSLAPAIGSLKPGVLAEVFEGLLSAFQTRLDTITLTEDDRKQALDKYGVRSEDGKSISIGDRDLLRDTQESIAARRAKYGTSLRLEDDLRVAKARVSEFLKAERPQRRINNNLGKCCNGWLKWMNSRSKVPPRERFIELLLEHQKKKFPLFGDRPIGQLALRVRDYLSLRVKRASLSAKSVETLFGQINSLFADAVISFLMEREVLTDTGRLSESCSAEEIEQLLREFRSQTVSDLSTEISGMLTELSNQLTDWEVFMPFKETNVRIESGGNLPEFNGVNFLTPGEAQEYYDQNFNNSKIRWDFSPTAEGVALVRKVSARDSTTAARIAYRKLQMAIDQLSFVNDPNNKISTGIDNVNAYCISKTASGEIQRNWPEFPLGITLPGQIVLREPKNTAAETRLIDLLAKLGGGTESQVVRQRTAASIYWYRKASTTKLPENRLLSFWIALETLLGVQDDTEKKIGVLIAHRAGLLAPAKVAVDGKITYGQLRAWAIELVEDVYDLRNEIIHGGIFEGPSFESFIDRFRSVVHEAIYRTLSALVADPVAPESLEEFLTWIWNEYPDDKVASS